MRRLRSQDLDAALGLAAACGARGFEPDSLTKALAPDVHAGYYCLIVLEPLSNQILGVLSARPDSPTKPDQGVSRVSIAVDLGAQLLGLDRALLAAFEKFAKARGILMLRARARGAEGATVTFLTRNGFREDHRMCYLVLDVANAPSFGQRLPEELGGRGVSFATYAYEAIDGALLASLVGVMEAAAQDWPPYYDEPAVPATADYMKELLLGGETSASCLLTAFAGDELVGFSNFRQTGDKTELQQGVTAVKHSHSGRGIGQALKAGVLHYAAEHGYATIETYNRADNAAMLHINEKFGFRCISEEVRFFKPLA